MLDCESDRNRRRRLERKVETRHHPACDVDGERQPWPLQRPTMLAIDDNNIDQCVIDLDDVEREVGGIFSRHWPEAIACSL